MKKMFVLGALLMSFLACHRVDIDPSTACDYTPPAEVRHPKAQLFQSIVDKYIRKGLPGMAVLIRDTNGLWVGYGGKADLKSQAPFLPCTVSGVASINKMMLAVLILKLEEEGKLSLDDKMDKYMPEEILKHVKNLRGATIRQLMNHTTGIVDVTQVRAFYLDLLNDPSKQWQATEVVKYIYDKEPEYELGTSCNYSNSNIMLLSIMLDRIAGGSHYRLLREKVLLPLGMTQTFYKGAEKLPPYTAQGYFDLYNDLSVVNVSFFFTGGVTFSTVFDLARFVEAVLRDKTFLKPESVEELMTFIEEKDPDIPTGNDLFLSAGMMKRYFNQPLNSQNYGLGHSGRDLGYNSNCFYFPNQKTTECFVVNFGSNGESRMGKVFYEFQDELTDAIVK